MSLGNSGETIPHQCSQKEKSELLLFISSVFGIYGNSHSPHFIHQQMSLKRGYVYEVLKIPMQSPRLLCIHRSIQCDVLFHLLEFSHLYSWKAHSMLTFKQDGAAPHKANVVLNFLSNHFHDWVFSDILGKLKFDGSGHSTLWIVIPMFISYKYS
jgi:hypothetical protein